DNGQTRWHYRYDGEHRLTEVISQPRDRNRPQTQVSFRYDPLGRRISKTRRQMLGGQPTGKPVTTRFVWEGFRLLQEVHGEVPLTYVYSDQDSYDPLARIDGVDAPEIFWFHCQPNGTPERMTDSEGQVRWEGVNSAWGKLLRESETQISGYSQNLRMQGQYLDRETGLHYNLFRYYDPDCGRFTQQDPIGLAGGINLYQYAPNALKYIDPLGLCKVKSARARQAKMLKDDVGYNISPKSWDQYPAIGRDGTFITDKKGALKYFNGIEDGDVTISKSLSLIIEKDMGLYPGSLSEGFNIRKIGGISNMQPRSPLSGNDYFLGPGQHLPGGAPEMVINSVPTSTPVAIRVNVN
ncbi:RHS repeat domain-containing protein, partial [Enterobacter hormaechei]|uniref:RHS repeat domain-containing protein n=1 Tax=Enterobacter hormaechei TaxID=158836 RepID=UPI000AB43CC4